MRSIHDLIPAGGMSGHAAISGGLMRISTKWVGGSAAAVTALGMAIGTAGAASAAPSQRATLTGSVPSWAASSAFKGAAAGSDAVGFRVYLGWRGGDAAANYATAVSTPGN